jgi:hypothetical protein
VLYPERLSRNSVSSKVFEAASLQRFEGSDLAIENSGWVTQNV